MITKEQALALRHGAHVHLNGECSFTVGPKGGQKLHIVQCRVNGQAKTWKRRPNAFQIPLKYGLYDYLYLTQYNADTFHLPEDCPALRAEREHNTPKKEECNAEGIDRQQDV